MKDVPSPEKGSQSRDQTTQTKAAHAHGPFSRPGFPSPVQLPPVPPRATWQDLRQ